MLILIVMHAPVFANPSIFDYCYGQLDTPEYRPLRDFYTSHPEVPRSVWASGGKCLRLNRNEFLILKDGLYHFNAKNGYYQSPDGVGRKNTEILRELIGANGNRYILIRSGGMDYESIIHTNFEILELHSVRKGRSFSIWPLVRTDEADPDLCGNFVTGKLQGIEKVERITSKGLTFSVLDYEIAGEGTSQIQLTFRMKAQNCSTGKIWKTERVFQAHKHGVIEVTKSHHSGKLEPRR